MTSIGTIAIIGGTGKLGSALAKRWLAAGHEVVLGSRSIEKAHSVAQDLHTQTGCLPQVNNLVKACEEADIVVVTVPFSAQETTYAEIKMAVAGKLVVDTTVPLVPPKVMRVQLPQAGSAALCAQGILGPDANVVSAFHNVAAHKLAGDGNVECDVMVFGDQREARARVVALANDAGLRGVHCGALANSVAAEALTSILIFVNKTYGVDGAGIAFTGHFETE